jgi:DNA-binding transcriptional LysR family regulator
MDDMMALLHADEAQLALVFERAHLDDREAFQEVGQEVLVAVASPSHPLVAGGPPTMADLIGSRQIAVASRDRSRADPRLLLARNLWRTESHLATLGLVQKGLGWAFVPRSMAAPMIAAGELAAIAFQDMSNELRLWVDVVWRSDRPQGLGARRYLELIGPHRARE